MNCGACLPTFGNKWGSVEEGRQVKKSDFVFFSFRHMYDHAANMYPQLIKNPRVRSGVQNFMAYVFSYRKKQ